MKIITEFLDYDTRINLLLTCKYNNKICKDAPIFFAVRVDNFRQTNSILRNVNLVGRWEEKGIDFENLICLDCSQQISYFCSFGEKRDFKLKTLPSMPSIKQLYCNNNSLAELDISPNIKILDISGNNIVNLPKILYVKEFISIRGNENIVLPKLPLVEKMTITDSKLKVLPPLPKCKFLNCNSNKLKELPAMEKVEHISCIANEIETIKNYPNVKKLYCSYNKIKEITNIPKLSFINCDSGIKFDV